MLPRGVVTLTVAISEISSGASPGNVITPTELSLGPAIFVIVPSPTCTPVANILADPGFEATTVAGTNPNWASTSTNFGSSLCTLACGVSAPPRTGNAWIWFDGANSGVNAEVGTVQQTFTIPQGRTGMLSYYMRISRVSAPSNSVMTVSVDGTVVQTINEPAAAEPAYTLRSVDLSAFANGQPRLLRFSYNRPAGTSDSDDFVIDDVALATTCPAATTATVSGRVVTPTGTNLRNAVVSLTDPLGVRVTATTSSFGVYSFANVITGQNYVIVLTSKGYGLAKMS